MDEIGVGQQSVFQDWQLPELEIHKKTEAAMERESSRGARRDPKQQPMERLGRFSAISTGSQ
jgi:hypothetical protein